MSGGRSAWEEGAARPDETRAPSSPAGAPAPVTEEPAASTAADYRDMRGRFLPSHAVGATTRFTEGNGAARRTGVRAFEERGAAALPPDVRDALASFQAGVTADQGGPGELTTIGAAYVRRLVELEGCMDLLVADLRTRGLMTPRGRVRNSYTLLLQTIDRWDRLAQRLGMRRRERQVPSFTEYRQQRTAEEAGS